MKARGHFQGLAPVQYSDDRVPADKEHLLLSRNESMFGVSPRVAAFMTQQLVDPSIYPDHSFAELRTAIAAVHGLNPDLVWCGAGSTTLLYLLATLYLEPGRSAVTSQYGYQYFKRVIGLNDAQICVAPEADFTVRVDAMLAAVRPDTALLFLANPGNPTGTFIPRSEILRLRDALPADVLLVLDEAYDEYVDEGLYGANFDLAERGNTAIVRTFSKAYGLAGLRIGWGYFPQETLILIDQVKLPNATSSLSIAAAAVAVGDQEHVKMVREETARARDRFTDQLIELGLEPVTSHTNFVLCRFASAAAAQSALAYLRNEGIVIRPMGMYGLHDYLRFSIGTGAQMDRVAHTLAAWRRRV